MDGADLLDPRSWCKHPEPVFWRNDAAGVCGPGHTGFFKSPDGREDWMVYHAKTRSDFTYDGRITRAQRIHWRPDGIPDLGRPIALGVDLPSPSGESPSAS